LVSIVREKHNQLYANEQGLTIINNHVLNLPQFRRYGVWRWVSSVRTDANLKRLSQKDLIIALGIAVAAIIIISSVYLKDSAGQSQGSSTKPIPEKKVKPIVLVKKVLEKLAAKTKI